MAAYGMVLPLWHYAADGAHLLERAVGEVGLDHVTVPAVTGPVQDFRLDPLAELPHFETAGGWHYPPKTDRTRGKPAARPASSSVGRIPPVRATWFGDSDVLENLADHARRLKIELVLRLDVRAAVRFSDFGLHAAQRNAWGQALPTAGACASHPDARELLRTTIEELGRYKPLGFQVVHWLPDDHVDRTLPRPLDWQPEARALLDICFCAACRQTAERAGVDADQAARAVRVSVGRLAEQDADDDGCRDPLVTAYQEARATECADWLRRLAACLGQFRCWLAHESDRTVPSVFFDLPRLVVVPPTCAIDEDRLQRLLSSITTDLTVGLSLPVWRPAFSEAPRLVRLVGAAARAGVCHFDFEGLPTTAAPALTWLRQAVRFARRG